MSVLRSLSNIAQGVAEELYVDFRDVAWTLLELLGLRQALQNLIHELNLNGSSQQELEFKLRKKRRNLVRIIGSAIPLKPVERPYLRYVALKSLSTSCDSLFSSTTQNIAEIGWDSLHLEKASCQSPSSTRRSSAVFAPSSLSTSATNSLWESSSALTKEDSALKIAALEEQLANLSAQISAIIYQTPIRPLTPPSSPVGPPPPPPPPPPPLPPLPSIQSRKSLPSVKSFSELIVENKGAINQHTGPVEEPSPQRQSDNGLSMAEVLKGLNKVKLKRVDRSPGGTPIRDRPRSPPPGDPASLIAAALKKRFAKFQVTSPEKDHDSTSGFSSPEGTPKTKRRSRRDDFSPEKASASSPSSSKPFILRRISKQSPKPKEDDVEQSNLPPFGQHLLKRRIRSPPPPKCKSPSTSSENSDLSR